jgi:hypothetical protein
MRRREVRCDRCGGPITKLREGRLTFTRDEDLRIVAITLIHVDCADPGEQGQPAAAFVESTAEASAALRAQARAPWASATRALERIRRLADQEQPTLRGADEVAGFGAPREIAR